MGTVLTTGLLVALIVLNLAVDPSPRNFRTLKIAAIASVASAVAAWLWPLQLAQLFLGAFCLAFLWIVARFLLWRVVALFRLLDQD